MAVRNVPVSHNDTHQPSGVVLDKTFKSVVARFKYPEHAKLYADALNKACNRPNKYIAKESDMVVK